LAYALQQLVNGITLGMIYGLIAVGYTMVYGIIGMINFAHGDVFMIGAFIGIIALTALAGITAVPLGLPSEQGQRGAVDGQVGLRPVDLVGAGLGPDRSPVEDPGGRPQRVEAVGLGVQPGLRHGIGAAGGAWPMDPSLAVPAYFMPQGISADLIATKYGFSRDDVDAYAVESQKRAAQAWGEGRFKQSVASVKDINGLTILAKDEHMRPSTTMQSLAQLQPAFVQIGELGGFDAVAIQAHPEVETVNHVHHAGNSSGIVDGAAAVLIGSKRAGRRAGLEPRARIKAFANIGSEPGIMLTGPVDVTKKLLKKAGMTLADIDLIEINEAFASVVLRYMQAFDLDAEKVNVNGGAIAMGHPLGATGAMILGTVLDELERRDLSTALVTLCIGAGMGTATIIERV